MPAAKQLIMSGTSTKLPMLVNPCESTSARVQQDRLNKARTTPPEACPVVWHDVYNSIECPVEIQQIQPFCCVGNVGKLLEVSCRYVTFDTWLGMARIVKRRAEMKQLHATHINSFAHVGYANL